MMRPWTTRQPLYQDAYDVTTDGLDQAVLQNVGATATLPLMEHGNVVGIFGMVQYEGRTWSPADRAVLEGVLRSLSLALERGESVARLEIHSQELERSNTKLEAANEELEAFSYSVSHDLRTPVRHIKSFADLLRKSLGPELDAKSTRYLGIVDDAASRMDILIDAMLDLSRTSRQPLVMGLVDLAPLVNAARTELETGIPDQRVRWTVSALPLVVADRTTLQQVMVNLLSNALKYSRTRPEAHIEVWTEERPQDWAVFVRDNGVGFDPRYVDKLFGVFQRLHRQDEFEGTGVGLANVRRVIARHGGTVFAQGVVDGGATFGFTLPRPP
ncbi:sensor histidine kinase [Deinococcus frigens]|uniref:sensor histidine kinase n=1 Tax=Deinococcus frigens TaxID=249403 RepID=UPI000A066CA6|nr:ATP-binding protein [Deinococcus frigens]